MKRKAIARIKRMLCGEAFNMHTRAWEAHMAVLDDLSSGHTFDRATIRSRLGMGPEQPRVQIVNQTAVLSVVGIMDYQASLMVRWFGGTSTAQLLIDFQRALADEQIKSIVFYFDTPGGSAIGNEELAGAVFAARGKKPIAGFVRGMCASAGYYVASSVDSGRLVATPSSVVGSVGTILRHAEASKAWAEFGVQWNLITHGENKKDGNSVEPLSAKARANLQEYVNAFGEQFVTAVARGRGVTAEEVMNRFGQGKLFLAPQAQSLGMIDRVGSLQDVMQILADDAPRADEDDDDGPIGSLSNLDVAEAVEDVETLLPVWMAGEVESGESTPSTAASPHEETNAAKTVAALQSSDDADQSAANAATISQTEVEGKMKITAKVKAALYALSLIESQDASDEVCRAAIAATFKARKTTAPETEAALLQKLAAMLGEEEGEQTASATSAAAASSDAQEEDERERRRNIAALGREMEVDAETVLAAIESPRTYADIRDDWTKQLENRERAVERPDGIGNPDESGWNNFARDAVDSFLIRCCESSQLSDDFKPSDEARQMADAPLLHFAQQCLAYQGVRVSPFDRPEEVALQALQIGGGQVNVFSAAGPTLNRPGDFPALLSMLANKLMDQALQLAEATYPIWTDRLSDVPDFKPRTLHQIGGIDELDLILDGDKAAELKMQEELPAFIQVDRFGDKVGLTPVMVRDDDLDAFTQGLRSLSMAHENTLNRLCIALIASNVTMPDGNALYDDSNHNNNITTGGGAPSAAQATAMKLRHRGQTGVGGKGFVKTPPAIALLPSAHEEAGDQTFLTLAMLAESKLPTTDATINVHRGRIRPVTEPELDAFSVNVWYTFANPRIRRVIAHMFQRGYGRNGRRTSWFDPDAETRWVKLEGRFGAAAISHRGSVRNSGEASP